jgi:hypothetical protein
LTSYKAWAASAVLLVCTLGALLAGGESSAAAEQTITSSTTKVVVVVIPGFPLVSIFLGLLLGIATLVIRHRQT